MSRSRFRLRFRKRADLRQIGHRDLIRTLERLFRRAGLALRMSEGFHPKPKLTFTLALAVGIEGREEVMELELEETLTAEQVLAALAPHCPPGLEFLSAEELSPGAKCPTVSRVTYEIPVPPERQAALQNRVAALWQEPTHLFQRDGRKKPIDLRALLEAVQLADGVLQFTVQADGAVGLRPREVLAALDAADLEASGQFLTRTAVELKT